MANPVLPESSPRPLSTLRLSTAVPSDIARAARLLGGGGTVAFPTETVYGLGANALNASAVEKIFLSKQRPHWDPLIVHVADASMLGHVVTAVDPVSRKLMARFWPGPLTLLLPRSERIPDAVTAGRALVGVRMPDHPVVLELIRAAGVPVAAPSANRFGHISPTTASHVLDDLDGRIDAVLDGGPCALGLESTVIEVVPGGIVIYRLGGLDSGELESLNDVGRVRIFQPAVLDAAPESLPSPGVGIRHYAPRARLLLVGGTGEGALSRMPKPLELSLVDAIDRASDAGAGIGVMLPEGWNASAAAHTFAWGSWHDAEALANRLYEGLRALDAAGSTAIVCPIPEMPGIGEAIRDRLRKAAMQ